MKRVAQLAVVAVIAVAVIPGLAWWLGRGEVPQLAGTAVPDAPVQGASAPPPAAPTQSGEPALSQAPPTDQTTESGEADAVAPSDGAQTAAPTPQVVARPTPDISSEFLAPSFDVVRIEKNGEAVIAGRAEPRSEVTLYDNGAAIGSTIADSNGEWVLVPEHPLAPGNHELGVTARGADGQSAQSSDVVIVFVPRPPAVAAAEPPQPAEPQPAEPQPAERGPATQSQVPSDAKPVAPETAPIGSQGNQPSNTPTSSPEAPATRAPLVAQRDTGAPEPQPADTAAVPDPAGVADTSKPDDSKPDEEKMAATTPESGTDGPLVIIAPREGGPARVLQQPDASEEGIVAGQLALETIDYERDGRASVGGRATPGNRVRIYLDNQLAGEAESDREGRWRTTLEVMIEPGLHQLRVDELGPDGQVIARIEAPFSRAEIVANLPRDRTVIVQWGNSLWRIARRTYGDGMQYHTIYQANANQIRDPDLIYPGQVFSLPEQN